jgi:hypothetical protein
MTRLISKILSAFCYALQNSENGGFFQGRDLFENDAQGSKQLT